MHRYLRETNCFCLLVRDRYQCIYVFTDAWLYSPWYLSRTTYRVYWALSCVCDEAEFDRVASIIDRILLALRINSFL